MLCIFSDGVFYENSNERIYIGMANTKPQFAIDFADFDAFADSS